MKSRERTREYAIGAGLIGLVLALGVGQALLARAVAAGQQDLVEAPLFEVDPFWPRPLPNHWLLGSTIGVAVDDRDHVWIIHRGGATLSQNNEMPRTANPPLTEECCVPAPPVLEFDAGGALVGHWGGPGDGYEWPSSNHGITVDHRGNVWIGGNGQNDSHVLKFTRSGRFLKQFGRQGVRAAPTSSASPANGNGQAAQTAWVGNSHDTGNFGRVAKIFVDPRANEAYLADGYLNKRVAVIDADTGAFKRYWGAYGNKPDDAALPRYDPKAPPAKQFRTPVHCADLSNDGLLYVCDRVNDRIQVFKTDGTFVREAFVARTTLGAGSVWDIAFSRDPGQRFLYLADGMNERVHVLDRSTLEVLTSFGDGGRQPGQFFGAHSIATDSKGNIYTTETYEGKRLQKFVYRGMGKVARGGYQGVVWPKGSTR